MLNLKRIEKTEVLKRIFFLKATKVKEPTKNGIIRLEIIKPFY